MARGDKTVMLTARITDEQAEFLEQEGGGSRSKGLDRILDRLMGVATPPPPVRVQAPTRNVIRKAPAPVVQAPKTQQRRFIGKR